MADLLAVLSLGIDLGFGQPMEHVLRRIALCPHWGVMLDGCHRWRCRNHRYAG
ncbi:MAG: hypothetical protein ACXWA9_15260 [Acidimicrobiia bacterium]